MTEAPGLKSLRCTALWAVMELLHRWAPSDSPGRWAPSAPRLTGALGGPQCSLTHPGAGGPPVLRD